MAEFAPNRNRLPRGACEHLWTKTMFMAMDHPDDLEEYQDEHARTAAYWCTKNFSFPVGPDELPACPDSCIEGRSCWTPRFPNLS